MESYEALHSPSQLPYPSHNDSLTREKVKKSVRNLLLFPIFVTNYLLIERHWHVCELMKLVFFNSVRWTDRFSFRL